MRAWLAWWHRLSTYDVFPAFSARVRRWVYHPLGILSGAAVVAVLCGFCLHPQGFALAGGIGLILILGVTWPWLCVRGMTGRLEFASARASEDESVSVRLTVRNGWPWPAWGLAVRGGWADADLVVAGLAVVPGRRTVLAQWEWRPVRRGVFPQPAARLSTGFPFGLRDAHRLLGCPQPIVVWPRRLPVGPVPLLAGTATTTATVPCQQVGQAGDVLGVRPYRRGDSPRRIHWGQSAKHDRLIVCELQATARPVIQFILDTDAAVHTAGPDGSCEWAIRIVASLAQGWLRDGAQVGVIGAHLVVAPAAGLAHLQRLLDLLAQWPTTHCPLAQVLARSGVRGATDWLPIVVTTDRVQGAVPCRTILLRSAAFDGPSGTWVGRPWLDIAARARIPHLLRAGWSEARHGS
jgi:uncharacterized protein (DUF58 family)